MFRIVKVRDFHPRVPFLIEATQAIIEIDFAERSPVRVVFRNMDEQLARALIEARWERKRLQFHPIQVRRPFNATRLKHLLELVQF